MSTLNTHTQEVKMISLKGFNSVTQLIEDKQNEIRSIFALHKAVLSIYKTENVKGFKGIELIVPNDVVNPIFKDMVKSVNPFFLLFGTFSLSKVINLIDKKDYLSLMKSYNHSVLTYANLSIVGRNTLLGRGEKITNLFQALENKTLSKLEFSKQLIEFYPSLAIELKKEKIAKNVAIWLFEQNRETFDLLNIANAYNVELENVRSDVQRLKGADGLIKFDTLLNDGFSLLSASAKIGYTLTIQVSTQAEKLALAKASAKRETVAKAKKAEKLALAKAKKAAEKLALAKASAKRETVAKAKKADDKKVVATAALEALAQ